MNAVTEVLPDPLVFTENAASKVRQLIEEEGNSELKLRVFVTGGGCSGFQYGMAFENQMEEGDMVFESRGVRVYVDQASAMYLEGATVDYVDSLMGGGFRIENPNAVSTCSCGQSFTAGAGDGAEASHAHGAGCGCGHH